MSDKGNLLKFAQFFALPALASTIPDSREIDNPICGTWNVRHGLQVAPWFFRQLLTLGSSGEVHETNCLLHTRSHLDLTRFGLPKGVSASDGMGSWTITSEGKVRVIFRKFLFDGEGRHFADIQAAGTLALTGHSFRAKWSLSVLDDEGATIVGLGDADSEGTRMSSAG